MGNITQWVWVFPTLVDANRKVGASLSSGDCSAPDLFKRRSKFRHVVFGAHADPHSGRPDCPYASDDYAVGRHGAGELRVRAADIHHEEVGFAGDVLHTLLLQKL